MGETSRHGLQGLILKADGFESDYYKKIRKEDKLLNNNRKITVSTGTNRKSINWVNSTMMWSNS